MDIEGKIEELQEDNESLLTEFFSMLLGAKLVGHIHHLQVKGVGSYAKHKALNKFYDEAGEIADTIIETYQGCDKELVEYEPEALVYGINMDALEYLEDLRVVIQEGRKLEDLSESHIQNEIDNFVTLIDQTVYKLTFLQ